MSLIEKPHVFTGRVVNGAAICAFCSATPLEAAYALGPTCKQPADETDELQATIEALQAQVDALRDAAERGLEHAIEQANEWGRTHGKDQVFENVMKDIRIIEAALSLQRDTD